MEAGDWLVISGRGKQECEPRRSQTKNGTLQLCTRQAVLAQSLGDTNKPTNSISTSSTLNKCVVPNHTPPGRALQGCQRLQHQTTAGLASLERRAATG